MKLIKIDYKVTEETFFIRIYHQNIDNTNFDLKIIAKFQEFTMLCRLMLIYIFN